MTETSFLSQEKIEEIVEEQIESAMSWQFWIVVGVMLLPVWILTGAGIYESIPFLLKVGFWVVLYIAYYKSQRWAVDRKVKHIIRDMRKATGE